MENQAIKETLEKQLNLLSKRSEETNDNHELAELTAQMVSLVKLLESQVSDEVLTCHQCVLQLPIQDLIDLYVARFESEHRYLSSRRM